MPNAIYAKKWRMKLTTLWIKRPTVRLLLVVVLLVVVGLAVNFNKGNTFQAVSPAPPPENNGGGGVNGQSGTVIHVAPTGKDTNDGLTWPNAKLTIAGALSALPTGNGEIWAKEATYSTGGTVVSQSNINFYGGFQGTETTLAERPAGKRSTFSGGNQFQTFKVNGASNFVFDQLGFIDGTVNWHGGALYLYSATNVTINNSVFQNSTTTATGNGGCLAIINGSATITNSIIRNCVSAATGGGLYELGAVVNASNLLVENNRAVKGGGIGLSSGDGLISGSTIRNNVATSTTTEGGGGIYMNTVQRLHIAQNVITGNSANYGAALDCFNYTTNTIKNNIITLNVAGSAAISVRGYGTATNFTNNTISDNRSTAGFSALSLFDSANAILRSDLYTYNSGPKAAIGHDANSNLNVGYSGAWGNVHGTWDQAADTDTYKWSMLEEDPLYLNRNFLTDVASYQLTPASPGRDYGQNNLVNDFANAFRPVNSRGWSTTYADKGAYEYQNIQQYLTMDGWRGPSADGKQDSALVRYQIFDANNKLLVDTQASQASNGFYLLPLNQTTPPTLPLKVLINPAGYLTKKITVTSLPNPLPTQLPTGANLTLDGGDVDGDNTVGAVDINRIFINYSLTNAKLTDGDVNGDGVVDLLDLNRIFLNFSKSGEI